LFITLLLGLMLHTGCPTSEDPVDDDTGDDDDVTADDDSGDDDTGDDDVDDAALFDALLAELETTTAIQKQMVVDAFMRTVHYSDGLPIHGDGELVFCVQPSPDPADGVSVAGDFNDWDPTSLPMERDPDVAFYWVRVPITGGPAADKYKFVHHRDSGDEWIADPWSRRYQYDEFGEFSLVNGDVGSSHLERFLDFESTDLGNSRTVRLYVPAGYDGDTDLPVLYMHDGQNLFDPDAAFGEWEVDETLDEMIAASTAQPVLVVGIDNTASRMEEYTHCADDFGHGIMGGDADLYMAFLVDEVMPFVESRYEVSPYRRGLLGSSLGGLVSMHIGWRHDDLFDAVGGMSSTLGWGAYGNLCETQMELWEDTPSPDLLIYLDSGGEVEGGCMDQDGDGIHEDSVDTDNYCVTLQMVSLLESKGYEHGVDLWHWWEMGAPHNETAWAERLPLFLEYVFPGP